MKIAALSVLLPSFALAQVVGAPPLAPAKPWSAPVPVERALASGARAWVHSVTALPLVHVSVAVPAGTLAEPNERAGLAALTASMVEEGGAGARGPADVLEAFDSLGTSLEVETRPQGVVFSFTVLSSRLESALALLADVLARPRFDEKAFGSVRQRRLAELTAELDHPRAVATTQLLKALFGSAPRGHNTNGTLDTVKALTLDDVKGFYAAHYASPTVTFVLVGDVTADAAKKVLDQVAPKPWLRAGPTQAPVASVAAAPAWYAFDKPGAAQTVLMLGHPTFAVTDPRFEALEEASVALGGSFTSRLTRNLREKNGYTYGVTAHVSPGFDSGLAIASTAVKTEVTAPALEQLLLEFSQLHTISAGERQKAEALLNAELVDQFSSGASASAAFAEVVLLGLPADRLSKQAARLAAVTLDQAVAASKEFDPDAFTVVIVGDRAVIEKSLTQKFSNRTIVWKTP